MTKSQTRKRILLATLSFVAAILIAPSFVKVRKECRITVNAGGEGPEGRVDLVYHSISKLPTGPWFFPLLEFSEAGGASLFVIFRPKPVAGIMAQREPARLSLRTPDGRIMQLREIENAEGDGLNPNLHFSAIIDDLDFAEPFDLLINIGDRKSEVSVDPEPIHTCKWSVVSAG